MCKMTLLCVFIGLANHGGMMMSIFVSTLFFFQMMSCTTTCNPASIWNDLIFVPQIN